MQYILSSKEMYEFSIIAKKHAVDYIALHGQKYVSLMIDKDGYYRCGMKVNGKSHDYKASSRKIITDIIFNGNPSGVHFYGKGIPFLRSVIRTDRDLYLNMDGKFKVTSEELSIINKIIQMEKKSK